MSTASAAVLRMVEIAKAFPIRSPILRRVVSTVRAVDGCSLSVHPGETVGLVGESGSGKSTLGRLALRLIIPTSGRVILDGTDITDLSHAELRPLRRKIQMVFQDPYSTLDPHAPISDSIAEPLRNHLDLRGSNLRRRVGELLDQVRLSPTYIDRYPHEFSGGQLQRIAIARAIALNPKVVVADEPVSSLDVSTQAQVLGLLEDLRTQLGMAYLFISHDLSVVNHISDRIAVMYLGRIVECGAAEEVVRRPRHPYTEALLSAVPIPVPSSERRRRTLLTGDPPSPTNPPSGCHFHTRCPQVMEVCRSVDPPMVTMESGTQVACHLFTTEVHVDLPGVTGRPAASRKVDTDAASNPVGAVGDASPR
jgi:peptide/nickel transport system ATP-binding protein